MSGQASTSGGGGAQKARDSFASILSYYEKNYASLESVPDWAKRASSGEIQIGVAKEAVPSSEQSEELKKDLEEALRTQDALNNLSTEEKELMEQVAKESIKKRKKGN
ncbi:hypothetical protein MMC24_003410 [Lignoscripta atroalba]|nr:hypothetical protein [Lignoscripta atroalba]